MRVETRERAAAWRSRAGRSWLAAALGGLLTACGGSNPSGPDQSPSPSPTPPGDVHAVSGFVFYDFERNNKVDSDETVRLGDVEVEISGRTGRSAPTTGQFTVQGVPAGTYTIGIRTNSLPPFFVAGGPVTVQVPSAAEIAVPVALPISHNEAFVFLSEGDSISKGNGSADGEGYRSILRAMLASNYDHPVRIYYRGFDGGTSDEGAGRIERDLGLVTPAYTLIAWGTNDWNSCGDPASCFTVPSLRSIVRQVKTAGSLPFVATIIPVNVGYNNLAPPSRNVWVAEANDLIRAMALEEGAVVVDLYDAFMREPSLAPLFSDHVHPNPDGYQLIAQTWFDALTRPRNTASAP